MKPKILADFQICVSVPLSYFLTYSLASLRAAFVIQKNQTLMISKYEFPRNFQMFFLIKTITALKNQ